MNNEQIMMKIKECLTKSNMPEWYVSEDEDVDADLYFDEDGFFCICRTRTKFKAEDFERICYRYYDAKDPLYGEYYSDASNYVKLEFKDGQEIFLQECGDIEARLDDGLFYDRAWEILERLRVCAYEIDEALSTETMIVRNGVLTNYKGRDAELKLPEGIYEIAANVFENNKTLECVTLPESLRIIRYQAFYNCQELKSVKFNQGLKTINRRAFAFCDKLDDVMIPDTVETIGPHAFYNDCSLKSVTLGEETHLCGDNSFNPFCGTPYFSE